jgi:4-diphosphocytidyl-2-C-methyl-D-erythritol kinase
VIRAAEALRERFDIADGAALRLDKRLPVAAGIGGGSADAAAALRLLARFWHVPASPEVLADIAEGLGADVPACIESVTVRGEGTGTMLLPADGAELSGLPVLLVNPRVACPTGQVFAAWGGEDRGALGKGSPLAAAHRGRNDLEPPAVALVPEIKGVLEQLRGSAGITLARMSGSGATCFGLFVSDTARDRAASFFPGCWVMAANLR